MGGQRMGGGGNKEKEKERKRKERKEREGIRPPPFLSRDPPHWAPPCLTAATPPPAGINHRSHKFIFFFLFFSTLLRASSCSFTSLFLFFFFLFAQKLFPPHVRRKCASVCRPCGCSWCCQVQGWLQQNNGSRRLQMNAPGKSVMELKGIRLWGICRLIKEL